jgi:ABC-type glycerol-3-phosphate transport system permease component
MAGGNSERKLKIAAYIFSFIFLIMIALPLVYIISLSLQDDSEIYSYPPKIIPKIGTSIDVVIDYTKYSDKTEDELKDIILRDSTMAMYSTIYELDKENVSEVKVYGTLNGKTIYYSRAHGLMLRLQLQYGVYYQARVSTRVLLANDNYKKSTDVIGYEFDLNGIDKSFDDSKLQEDKFYDPVENYLNTKYEINGVYQGTISSYSYLLLLENYKYYYLTPTYLFKNIPTIKNYSFLAFMFNTVLTFVWAVICQVGLCSLTAYPLSKLLSKKAADRVLIYFLATLMIPFVCIMIPQLILMKDMGMFNNYAGMLFPWLLPSPFYIFLFKGFFDRIPTAYFDAARIDGASELYTFLKICMPMSKPIITLIALQSFITGWSDFFWYFLVANKQELWTLNVAIYTISKSTQVRQNLLMGLSVVTILPVLAITAIFSKQIKSSVMSSGIKG